MITYQVETLDECLEEAIELGRLLDAEVNPDGFSGEFSVDREQYRALERAGMLLPVTAREGRKLIGFIALVLSPHIHYSAERVAAASTLYVAKSHRGTRAPHALLSKALRLAKDSGGASRFTVHMSEQIPFHRLLERVGFQKTGETWETRIDVHRT